MRNGGLKLWDPQTQRRSPALEQNLKTGESWGGRDYNTSSTAWQGVFSAMTDGQVDAICQQIVADLVHPTAMAIVDERIVSIPEDSACRQHTREFIHFRTPAEQSMELPSIEGLIVLPTQHTVKDILTRTVSIAHARGITVFAKIDFSGDAAQSKLTLRPTGLVILGNPAAGTPVMAATPTAAIDLPLKILAFEDAQGQTWVAFNDPIYLQRRHGFPDALVKNLEPIGGLAQAVAGSG